MIDTFNTEEQTKLLEIVESYRNIFSQASYLSLQMTKLEEELQTLMKGMDELKEEESGIYVNASERTKIDIEEIKKIAGTLILAHQNKKNVDTELKVDEKSKN
jgi:hypothetical protein